jgi:capsular exopolysaccharide synthesis family protein
MSRVDEALRRASSDTATFRAPIGVEPPAVIVDESALERYGVERAALHVEKPRRAVLAAAPPPAPKIVAPVAAPMPAVRDRFTAFHRSLEGKVVSSRETSPVSVEQYRRLAVTLIAAQAERGLKTLMVSSALPNEGKTLTVTNLALTLSESYARSVLLIDADMRRPCIHELFGLANTFGLADSLRTSGAQLQPIQMSSRLSILPAGHADGAPMADLSSERMQKLVAAAASRFDWVLVDTPPIGLLSDANLVARVTDGVLFVIAAGRTPYRLVQQSIGELGADRIVGTVLNRVDERVLGAHSYYEHYYPAR